MGATADRAKLLGVRALSTILIALAVATPAGAQYFGAPRSYAGNALWLSAGSGDTRAVTLSDNASGGIWRMLQAKPLEVALDLGNSDRSVGVSVRRAVVPLTFQGTACTGCAGQVQSQVMLGTYRRATPLFASALRQIVELGAGLTRWSALTGRDGATLPIIASNDDFTYSVSVGIGMPLGDRLEAAVHYDMLQTRHEMQTSGAVGTATRGYTAFNTLRFSARLRLGQ